MDDYLQQIPPEYDTPSVTQISESIDENEENDFSVEEAQYEKGKPFRIVIRANISHD